MATQVERTASARKRLIAATIDLVATNGAGNTSVAAIGEQAGMSRGAVNFHFGSKDELLTAVAEEITAEWEAKVLGSPAPDTPVEETISGETRVHADSLHDDPATFRIFAMLLFESLGPSPHLHQHFVDLHKRVRAGLAQQFRALQDKGHMNGDVDPDGFATYVIGAFRGITFQYLLDPTLDIDAALAEVDKTMAARLRP